MTRKLEIGDRELWLLHLDECKRTHSLNSNVELAEHLAYRRQELEQFINGNGDDLPSDRLRAKIMWSLRDTASVTKKTRAFISHLAIWDNGLSEDAVRDRWLEKLDAIVDRYQLTSDSQLAVFLGISRQALSKFRHGASRLPSIGTQARIIDLLGMAKITEQVWSLLPKAQAATLRELTRKSARLLRLKNAAKD